MKVIIAGSREVEDEILVFEAYQLAKFVATEVVSGGCRGVDAAGEQFATDFNIPIKVFPADWIKYGKGAGPMRNRQMAKYADALIAIWDGKSRGTKNMIDEMNRLGKPVYVHLLENLNGSQR